MALATVADSRELVFSSWNPRQLGQAKVWASTNRSAPRNSAKIAVLLGGALRGLGYFPVGRIRKVPPP